MYIESSTPQVLAPPPALLSIHPPPPLYTPPNPQNLRDLLKDLLLFFLNLLMQPFTGRLVPVHPLNPYGIPPYNEPRQQQQSTAVVPVRKERRSRSKSPSSSPTTSITLTEGTIDGRPRQTGTDRGGIEIKKVRIRGGKRRDAVVSKHEAWAKEAFGY
jgi:hypothetical protein